jgi:hypothetical protein
MAERAEINHVTFFGATRGIRLYDLVMQRTLQEHITRLEQKIVLLQMQLTEPDLSPAAQNGIRVDLGMAERALIYFQQAYDLERKISN